MKQVAFLLGVVLFAFSAGAQTSQEVSTPSPSASPAPIAAPAASTDSSFLYASIVPNGALALPGPAIASSPAQGQSGGQAPSVYGVFMKYNWQLSGGYAFVRFYETPSVTKDLNGLYISMVYYPGGRWIGADGEIVAAFGSQGNQTAKFAFVGGGPRFRWSGPRGLELWAHGLVGFANFLPQTAFGKQSAFGFDGGGGVDLNIRQKRFAYRIAAGVMGTRFFSTYQYSPYASAGIVFKF